MAIPVRILLCALILVSICSAQIPVPDSPLVTLQLSATDASPASPVLIGVHNSGGPGAPLTLTARISPTTQNWLRVTRVAAALADTSDACPKDPASYIAGPGTLTINTQTDKLCVVAARTVTTPGNYSGFITLAPPSGNAVPIIVNLNIAPAGHLLLTPDAGVAFNENILTFTTGGPTTPAKTIRVDVVDPANPSVKLNSPVSYSVRPDANPIDWLSIQCFLQDRKTPCGANPMSPIYLQIAVSPVSATGQLVAKIEIGSLNASYAGNDVITVQANITGVQPTLTVDTTLLTFSSFAGVAAALPAQSIKIGLNTGTLSFTVSAAADDNTNWLSVAPASGTAPGTISVIATPGAMRASGVYTGSVTVTPAGGTAVKIPVTLRVAGLIPVPATPVSFVCAAGESTRIAVTSTDPSVVIPFTAMAANAPWLSIAPATSSTPVSIALTTNCAGLAANAYTSTVTLLPTGAASGPQIPVTLTVSPVPILTVNPATLTFAYDITSPVASLAAQTLTVSGNVSTPFTATAQTDSGLNWLVVTPASGRSNASLTVSVNPAGLAASATRYTGKITIAYGASQIVVPVTLSVTTTSAPTLATSSAASGLPVLAPDSIASAYGTNLTASSLSPDALPLPTTLGGVSVRVKDSAGLERLAPLFYVSPGQVNYLVPAGTAPGAVTVTIGTASGSAQVNSIAPGLFTANANGKGAPAATAARYSADGSATPVAVFQCAGGGGTCSTSPISLGGPTDQVYLTLYGTGIRGLSSPAGVRCQIGGVDAPVVFAGAQGGFVGLDQVNVILPQSLAGKGEVDLALTVDGVAANAVRVNLQ